MSLLVGGVDGADGVFVYSVYSWSIIVIIIAGKRRAKAKRGGIKSLGRLAVGMHGMRVVDECQFIPLRLDARERGLLAMLKGALNVSEYTDR